MKDYIRILGLLGLLSVFFLTSCRQESKVITSPKEVDTYISVSLSVGTSSFRKEEDNYNRVGTWDGKDQIETIDVFVLDAATVHRVHYLLGDLTVTNLSDGTVLIKPKRAIRTTSGKKKIYALVNAPTKLLTFLDKVNTPSDFETKWTSEAMLLPIKEVASYDELKKKDKVMSSSSEPSTVDVKPDISEDDALTTTKNHIKMSVKRVVSRILVTSTKDTYEVSVNGKKIGTLSDLTYAGAQWDKKFYIGQKRDKQLIKSPNYTLMPGSLQDYYTSRYRQSYDYSDLLVKDRPVPVFSKGHLTDPNKEIEATWLDKTIFMYETTHKYQSDPSNDDPNYYDGGYKRGNTAYVLIRGVFVPETFADGGKYTKGESFYLGANNRFYTSPSNVIDPKVGGIKGQSYITYEKGKVLYFAYLNPDNTTTPLESPVFRNSLYHLNIKKVHALGLNYNPLYPESRKEGEDTPDEDFKPNPDPSPNGYSKDPINPSDPLSPLANWMSVEITVIPWNVIAYDEILGK